MRCNAGSFDVPPFNYALSLKNLGANISLKTRGKKRKDRRKETENERKRKREREARKEEGRNAPRGKSSHEEGNVQMPLQSRCNFVLVARFPEEKDLRANEIL